MTASTPAGRCRANHASTAAPRSRLKRELALTMPIFKAAPRTVRLFIVRRGRANQSLPLAPFRLYSACMANDYFFCGVGGSGMLPLAMFVRAQGNRIAGSDRSRDQGRTPEKFAWLEAHGVALHPQDGSGVVRPDQIVVATGAVEDTVPDIGAAK